MNITVTNAAKAEIEKIVKEQEIEGTVYLRLRVVGGGCSGFQHKLDLDEEVTAKDGVYESNGVKVVIDHRSVLYLDGVIVDFVKDLNQMGFKVTNPTAKSTCGCGSSFSM